METKQSWNLELWDEAKQETNHDAGFRFRVAVVVLVSTPALEQLSPKHQIPHIESVLIQQIKWNVLLLANQLLEIRCQHCLLKEWNPILHNFPPLTLSSSYNARKKLIFSCEVFPYIRHSPVYISWYFHWKFFNCSSVYHLFIRQICPSPGTSAARGPHSTNVRPSVLPSLIW